MFMKPDLSEYHIIGWSPGNYGSARRKALSKRNEADRRRRDQLKALEQNANFFNIISGAGAPPKFSGSDMGLSGRYAMGGSAAGKTGWGFDEVTVGYSSDFRPQPIKQKKIWFQYQEGFRHGGGKYVGQWGTRDARIGYEGAEDWQRKINAAWWGRKDREAEVQKVKDVQASIVPWDVYEKQQQSRWSGRKYGLSADTQATMASEAEDAGGVGQGSGKKESYKTAAEKAAENAKVVDPTQDWLDTWNESMGTNTTKDDLARMNFGGDRVTQVKRLLDGDEITERERGYLEKKLRDGLEVGDEKSYTKELNRLMSKYSDSLSGVPGAPPPSRTTFIGKGRDDKKNPLGGETKMNFLYDEVISKSPSIDIDVSHHDRDVVLASFIDKERELTDREFEIREQLTTGLYETGEMVGSRFGEDTVIDWGDGKKVTLSATNLSPEAKAYYAKLDKNRKPRATVVTDGYERGILQTELETIQQKREDLGLFKSTFMSNEESLRDAERINTVSTERKKAMQDLKDYKPFEDIYGADYLNYLNPEQVSGFYERSQELPRLTATGVSSTYYNILGGSDYDPRLFEQYSTTYDPETHIYIKKPTGEIDGYGRQQYTYERMDQYADEEGQIDFSKLDDSTKKAIRSGDAGFLGYSQSQERAYSFALAEGDEDKMEEILLSPEETINLRTASRTLQQEKITDDSTLAFLRKTYQQGEAEVDYTDINQLSEKDNLLDSRGRLRDHERYGQAMGRLYFSTKKEVPTIKVGIESLQTEVDALRVEKKALDTTYRDYRSQIRERQGDVRETYKKTGKVDFDQGFADEISVFSKKRQAAKLALNIKEQKLDKLKKNLAATEKELENLREQKSDWLPSTEGGGGKIVNPARFAKYQMLAGHSTTSAMSPGERSARAQVRQRQVARTGKKIKGKINMIGQYGRSSKDGWDDTFSSFDKLAGLKRQRTQLFRIGAM